jgi:hypothetical protein
VLQFRASFANILAALVRSFADILAAFPSSPPHVLAALIGPMPQFFASLFARSRRVENAQRGSDAEAANKVRKFRFRHGSNLLLALL